MKDSSSDTPGAMVVEALGQVFRRALRRGQAEVGRAAESSRRRLEQRQLKKDLDHFWIRLGKTSQQLVLAGEVDHPALRKAMARIASLEAELDALKASESLAAPSTVD